MSYSIFSGGVFIPEVELYNNLKRLEGIVKQSVLDNENNNILHKIFDTHQSVGDYNYLNEAIEFFKNKTLDIKIGFNVSSEGDFPKVNIVLPFSGDAVKPLGLSSELEYNEVDESGDGISLEEVKEKYRQAKYSIMFIGDNGDLVTLLYYVFDYLFLADSDNLETSGLLNIDSSGSDLSVERGFIPQNLFMRSLMFGFDYVIRSVNLNGILKGIGYNVDKVKLDINKQ